MGAHDVYYEGGGPLNGGQKYLRGERVYTMVDGHHDFNLFKFAIMQLLSIGSEMTKSIYDVKTNALVFTL